MILLLTACGLLERPTPVLPESSIPPLQTHWTKGAGDMFVALTSEPPDGAVDAVKWWHGPEGEKPAGATDRLGPPVGVATLLREDYATWNILELDTTSFRFGTDRPISLVNGAIPDAEKRGKLIVPLYEAMLVRGEYSRAFASRAGVDLPEFRVGLRVAADVPWGALSDVVFTNGQAMFGTQCFLGTGTYESLEQRCFEPMKIYPPGREPPLDLEVEVRADGVVQFVAVGEVPFDASGVKKAPKRALIRIPDPTTPSSDVARWVGEVARTKAFTIELTTVARPVPESADPARKTKTVIESSKLLEKLLEAEP